MDDNFDELVLSTEVQGVLEPARKVLLKLFSKWANADQVIIIHCPQH